MTLAERNAIVTANIGLVYGAVRKYARYMPQDDSFQVAAMALIRAVEAYDPGRGFKFSGFAYACMRTALWCANKKEAKHRGRAAQPWEVPTALPEAESLLHSSELTEEMERRLQDVPPRERFALRYKFGLGVPRERLADTGRRLGVCKERVRQLCDQGLSRIRGGL